jgi:hypothetical protein
MSRESTPPLGSEVLRTKKKNAPAMGQGVVTNRAEAV